MVGIELSQKPRRLHRFRNESSFARSDAKSAIQYQFSYNVGQQQSTTSYHRVRVITSIVLSQMDPRNRAVERGGRSV